MLLNSTTIKTLIYTLHNTQITLIIKKNNSRSNEIHMVEFSVKNNPPARDAHTLDHAFGSRNYPALVLLFIILIIMIIYFYFFYYFFITFSLLFIFIVIYFHFSFSIFPIIFIVIYLFDLVLIFVLIFTLYW